MRVSRLYKKEEAAEIEVFPLSRIALWAVIGLVILVGITLYFRFDPFMTSLL